jgi:hypothetical protein
MGSRWGKEVWGMVVIKREIFVIFRIIASCLTAACLIFFFSSLAGEDLIRNNATIDKTLRLMTEINGELNGGITKRISQLGAVPEKNPFRKFYAVELAKEIHELSQVTEKQRIMFDTYNVRGFEAQLKRMMQQTQDGDVDQLMQELEIVKRELKNSANLLDKKNKRLVRQRLAYIALFFLLWIGLYLYFSRGIIFKKDDYDD